MVENRNQSDYLAYNKKIHGYSPAIQTLLDLAIHYVENMENDFKAGKNVVGYIFDGMNSPFIYACGAIPFSLVECGRLADKGGVQIAEDYFLIPEENCSMVKSTLGQLYKYSGQTVNRIVYESKMCEPFNQAMEMIKDYGYETYVLDRGYYPKRDSKRAATNRSFCELEYEKLAVWLGGKPVDPERLREEMKRYNRIFRKVRTILNLRKIYPSYMKSLATMLLLIGSDHYYGRPEEYEDALDQLIEEMSRLKPGEYNDTKVNILWNGARGVEFGVYQAVDDAGGAILGWSIGNNLEVDFDLTKDPKTAFFDTLLRIKHATGTSESVFAAIESQLQQTGAKGILNYGFMGCSMGSIGVEMARQHFQEKNIPFLSILGSYQVGAPSGQVITRVKAFMEMLVS